MYGRRSETTGGIPPTSNTSGQLVSVGRRLGKIPRDPGGPYQVPGGGNHGPPLGQPAIGGLGPGQPAIGGLPGHLIRDPQDPWVFPGSSNHGDPKDKGKGKGGKKNPIQQWLSTDVQYQKDRADLLKNFKNLLLANKENRGNIRLDQGTTLDRLGTQQGNALEAMNADFAARGLFGGAEYQGQLGKFNQDYTNQQFDTNQSAQRSIADLLRQLTSGRDLKDEQIQQARLEAIRRRAVELGITG